MWQSNKNDESKRCLGPDVSGRKSDLSSPRRSSADEATRYLLTGVHDTARHLQRKDHEIAKLKSHIDRLERELQDRDREYREAVGGRGSSRSSSRPSSPLARSVCEEQSRGSLREEQPDSQRLARKFPPLSRVPLLAEVERACSFNHLRFRDHDRDAEVQRFAAEEYCEALRRVHAKEFSHCLHVTEHLQQALCRKFPAHHWTVAVGWYAYTVSNADKYVLFDCDTLIGMEFPRVYIARFARGDVVAPRGGGPAR